MEKKNDAPSASHHVKPRLATKENNEQHAKIDTAHISNVLNTSNHHHSDSYDSLLEKHNDLKKLQEDLAAKSAHHNEQERASIE